MTRTPSRYFEDQYRESADPWGFASRWYETRKYACTLASLPDRRYRSAFEPGCSIGVLTDGLAERCDGVLAADHQDRAVAAARERTRHRGNVTVERRTVPDDWPSGPFDLLVLSEVCYYFDRPELEGLFRTARTSLQPGATVVAVHWRGETDYPLSGDETHRILGSEPELTPLVHHREAAFVLDVWRLDRLSPERPPPARHGPQG